MAALSDWKDGLRMESDSKEGFFLKVFEKLRGKPLNLSLDI